MTTRHATYNIRNESTGKLVSNTWRSISDARLDLAAIAGSARTDDEYTIVDRDGKSYQRARRILPQNVCPACKGDRTMCACGPYTVAAAERHGW